MPNASLPILDLFNLVFAEKQSLNRSERAGHLAPIPVATIGKRFAPSSRYLVVAGRPIRSRLGEGQEPELLAARLRARGDAALGRTECLRGESLLDPSIFRMAHPRGRNGARICNEWAVRIEPCQGF